MRRKIIDDFRLLYLNDLFEIKLISSFFLNLYGRYILRYESFLIIFSLSTQLTQQVKLVAIKSLVPLHFSRTLPLTTKKATSETTIIWNLFNLFFKFLQFLQLQTLFNIFKSANMPFFKLN